ncbi:MAG: hypothetical protein KDC54_17195, partial [Lewinella sp.]|nr:hypothetical protein [Lewinella sp.]
TYRPKIDVDDFEWGQEYDVTISDIVVDCACGGDEDSPCTAYPPKEVKPNAQDSEEHDETKPGKVGIYIRNDENDSQDDNVNCDLSEAGWNDDETVFSFKLTTKEENTGAQVSQRFEIKSQCHAEGCRYSLCYRTIHFYLKR